MGRDTANSVTSRCLAALGMTAGALGMTTGTLGMTMVFARALSAQPTIELNAVLVITRAVRITPKTYRLPGSDSGVITIRGNNIVVDFNGATLTGIEPSEDPDRAIGLAIRIDGGRNVEVRNARVRGYKVGLLARGTRK